MTQESAKISFTGHWKQNADRSDHYGVRGVVLCSPPTHTASASEEACRSAPWRLSCIRTEMAERLIGPGGYYNLGNIIGLASGIIFQLTASGETTSGETRVAGVVGSYLFGSPSATAITVATAVFLASGELYHRAWRPAGGQPDRKRLLQADLLSGVGAVCLAVALLLLGSVWLALASTALLAGGKFGNALAPDRRFLVRIRSRTFDAFRLAPALSRVPALVALSGMLAWSAATASGDPSQLLQSGILLLCYCLWFRADLLLLRA